MLRLEQVILTAGDEAIDLAVSRGEGVALIGPSGGKRSRLLALAAGLVEPHAGRVTLDDEPVRPFQVGFVDEDRSVLGALTAVENVATRVLLRGRSRDVDWTSVDSLLQQLGLPESSWHNLAEQLSGGQQQRVALARALFDSPLLLCLDDPVSELDDASAGLIWGVVGDAVDAGAILLVGLPEPDLRAPTTVTRTFPRS